MAEDLLRSLANLEEMLKDMSSQGLINPHLDKEESREKEIEVDNSPYCIKNGSYVRIEDDCMKAWIYLNPPKKGEDFYSPDLIREFLYENGVKAGYHQSNLAAIAKKHVYEREILIATGKNPTQGENGYFEYFFDTSDHRRPAIREDGTVDYSSMSTLSNVEEGQKIAEYHPAVQPENGYDVTGKEIIAKPCKEIVPLRGKDISNDENPNIYIAKRTGKIDLKNGHIDIKSVHEVNGDVDLVIGKIEFFGDIHITGNVGAGVVIRGSRNVTIDGVMEAATIYAGGDVVLVKGVQGNQKGKITAKGNVSAEFIEQCTIEAGGNVRSNSYVNANVYAAGMVMAEGKNGLILGGQVRGLKGVSAVCMGNDVETKTFVASGYSVSDYERYIEVFQAEANAKKALSEIVDRMTEILKAKRLGRERDTNSADKELLDLNEKKDEFFEELDKARTEKEFLSDIIEKGKGSVILANDKIYRGVTICIEGNLYQVPESTSFMRYKNEGGRIVPGVIILN